jgi:flagellar hook-associated protein 1 FlgK
MADSQAAIAENLEMRKESISGVSLDEEMMNLISYQHTYSAASRVLSAVDEALDILINRTGRVGL